MKSRKSVPAILLFCLLSGNFLQGERAMAKIEADTIQEENTQMPAGDNTTEDNAAGDNTTSDGTEGENATG